MPKLLFRIQEPSKPVREVVAEAGITLGRSPDNECVLEDPNISGRHAQVVSGTGGELIIEDLGSSNRTYVIGGPVLTQGQGHPLLAGMQLRLGKTIIDVVAAGPAAGVESTQSIERVDAAAAETIASHEPDPFAETDPTPVSPRPAKDAGAAPPPTEKKPAAAAAGEAPKVAPQKKTTAAQPLPVSDESAERAERKTVVPPPKPAATAKTEDEKPAPAAAKSDEKPAPASEKPSAPPKVAAPKADQVDAGAEKPAPAAKKAPALPDIPDDMPAGTRAPKTYWLNRYEIDLSRYSVKHTKVQCQDFEDVLGGCARGYKLLEKVDIQDCHDPKAPLIMNLGILSGTQMMTGLRTYFQGYSPLKASLHDQPSAMWAAGSGKFGTKLRYLGIDEIVFTGRAVVPIYVHIKPGGDDRPAKFQFKNGEHLVGRRANDKIQTLYREYPDAHFAVIGPAGENYENVRYASIALSTINQLRSGDMKSRFCGRGGFGGLMGSKNMLGIVADTPDLVRPKVPGLKEINMHVARGEGSRRFRDKKKGDGGGGTWANMTALNPLHAMPEYNFNPSGTAISEPLYRANVEATDGFTVKDEACFACGIACHKNVYETDDKGKPAKFRAKLDYEPLNLLSSNIGIFDIDQATHLVDLVDDLCMDSISCGVTLAYAMEYNRRCKEKGIKSVLPSYIEFGNFNGAERAILDIGEGRFPLLGQGSKRLSEALGETGYAMHCKGVEFPAYLPQFNPGYPWALAGGHMSMRTYLLYVFERETSTDYWVDAVTQRGPMIMRDDVVGICKFSGSPNDHVVRTIGAVAGLAITEQQLQDVVMRTFLRGYRLEQKMGFTRDDYVLPAEVHDHYEKVDLDCFNTPEFFAELKEKVCDRFDEMVESSGI